jgi:hypothetical protein
MSLAAASFDELGVELLARGAEDDVHVLRLSFSTGAT